MRRRAATLVDAPLPRDPTATLYERTAHTYHPDRNRPRLVTNILTALDLAGLERVDADEHAVFEGVAEIVQHLSIIEPYGPMRVCRAALLKMSKDEVVSAIVRFSGSHLPEVESAVWQGYQRYRHTIDCLRKARVKITYYRNFDEFRPVWKDFVRDDMPILAGKILKPRFG
ncbi:hypothetical protein Q8F55_003405 [Vanrija albida]|uniref:J domain-containing protein n=1 Tax=Vanrija albida TaxID=181172 RepID=A0ABR3Q482_9TREE